MKKPANVLVVVNDKYRKSQAIEILKFGFVKMFTKILMKMCLYVIVILNLFACFDQKSNADKQLAATDSIPTKVQPNLDEKKIKLVETVLNLPGVIRFSKIEFIRKKYGKVYILLEYTGKNDTLPIIMQSGKPLHVLHSADSITEDTPCYIFEKMEILGDSAYIRMKFDITGAMAFGSLKYTDRQWVPDKEFLAGVR